MIKNNIDVYFQISKILLFVLLFTFIVHVFFMILLFGFERDYVYGLSPLFAFDGEQDFPSWFSTLNLAFSGFLLYLIYTKSRLIRPDRHWRFLSCIFMFLSLDEMISLHERLVSPLRNGLNLEGYLYFSWVIVGLIFVFFIGLFSIPFLRRLPVEVAIKFIIAGSLFILGAIGMEMLGASEAFDNQQQGLEKSILNRGIIYGILITIEEMLEMSAIVYFNFILVGYMKNYLK